RPFTGEPGAFRRTAGRRDFALPPPHRTYLDLLAEAGVRVCSVGKVSQVFAGRGVSDERPAHDNPTAIAAVDELFAEWPAGLVFANLVDTDSVYGHRNDTVGLQAALREIDAAVDRCVRAMTLDYTPLRD